MSDKYNTILDLHESFGKEQWIQDRLHVNSVFDFYKLTQHFIQVNNKDMYHPLAMSFNMPENVINEQLHVNLNIKMRDILSQIERKLSLVLKNIRLETYEELEGPHLRKGKSKSLHSKSRKSQQSLVNRVFKDKDLTINKSLIEIFEKSFLNTITNEIYKQLQWTNNINSNTKSLNKLVLAETLWQHINTELTHSINQVFTETVDRTAITHNNKASILKYGREHVLDTLESIFSESKINDLVKELEKDQKIFISHFSEQVRQYADHRLTETLTTVSSWDYVESTLVTHVPSLSGRDHVLTSPNSEVQTFSRLKPASFVNMIHASALINLGSFENRFTQFQNLHSDLEHITSAQLVNKSLFSKTHNEYTNSKKTDVEFTRSKVIQSMTERAKERVVNEVEDRIENIIENRIKELTQHSNTHIKSDEITHSNIFTLMNTHDIRNTISSNQTITQDKVIMDETHIRAYSDLIQLSNAIKTPDSSVNNPLTHTLDSLDTESRSNFRTKQFELANLINKQVEVLKVAASIETSKPSLNKTITNISPSLLIHEEIHQVGKSINLATGSLKTLSTLKGSGHKNNLIRSITKSKIDLVFTEDEYKQHEPTISNITTKISKDILGHVQRSSQVDISQNTIDRAEKILNHELRSLEKIDKSQTITSILRQDVEQLETKRFRPIRMNYVKQASQTAPKVDSKPPDRPMETHELPEMDKANPVQDVMNKKLPAANIQPMQSVDVDAIFEQIYNKFEKRIAFEKRRRGL